LISGNIDFLRRVADEDKKNDQKVSNAANYLAIINRSGIAGSFDDHQKIVSSVLRSTRTWAAPDIRDEDRDEQSLVIYHWVLADRATRNRLQSEILDALRAHYQNIKDDLSRSLSVVLNRVVEGPQMVAPVAVASVA
jgi:hypothetical protein